MMPRVIVQYLLSPIVFPLTVIFPIVFFFVDRRYVWFSIVGVGSSQPYFVGNNGPFFVGKLGANQ